MNRGATLDQQQPPRGDAAEAKATEPNAAEAKATRWTTKTKMATATDGDAREEQAEDADTKPLVAGTIMFGHAAH